MKGILLLATGGTFDKEYDELKGSLLFSCTHLPQLLKLARNQVPVRIHTLFLKDSLLMTDEDRKAILLYCVQAVEDRIIITHGTDTMSETATYLSQHTRHKTIVLTGAMVPYAFGSSDGLFNLGSAFGFVQALPPGVFVSMNGRCFEAGKVKKNKVKGIFEEV